MNLLLALVKFILVLLLHFFSDLAILLHLLIPEFEPFLNVLHAFDLIKKVYFAVPKLLHVILFLGVLLVKVVGQVDDMQHAVTVAHSLRIRKPV